MADWPPDAEAIILLDCYQPVAEPGRGPGVGAMLWFWTLLIGRDSRPACWRLSLYCAVVWSSSYFILSSVSPFTNIRLTQVSELTALPTYFCSLLLYCLYRTWLTLSWACLMPSWCQCVEGSEQGWVQHCRWQLCHTLLEWACPGSGIVMKNLGSWGDWEWRSYILHFDLSRVTFQAWHFT